MDRLHLMTVYVAVAEEEGFAAGARRLGMSPPAVTRAVSALEESLGVQLLSRTTRYVRATEAGIRYLEDARRIIAEVYAADEAAAGINAEPRGKLCVTAPVLFGRMFVTAGVVDYLQRYPSTEVDALFVDRVVNMLEEGVDVGVRIGELADSSMRALRVGSVRLILVASPEYLNKNGIPQHPYDLKEHAIIASHAVGVFHEWGFVDAGKKTKHNNINVRVKPRLTVSTNDTAIEAAVNDFGITRVLSYQVADKLASGELKIILENYERAARPVHIVHRQGRLASAKVRSFIDLLAERLRADKALN